MQARQRIAARPRAEGRARAAQSGRGGKAKVPRRPSSEDLEAPLTDSGAGSPSSTGRVERARGREGATAVAGAGYLSEVQLNQARPAHPPHTRVCFLQRQGLGGAASAGHGSGALLNHARARSLRVCAHAFACRR
jgi:hypothetical protein